MKNLFVIIAFLTLASGKGFAGDFTITPQIINFLSIEDDGKTLVALGDNGYVVFSEDDGATWRQIRPFDRGIVLKFEVEDNRIVAFNSAGDISFSYDKAQTWKVKNLYADPICDVIKTTNGYFLRGRNTIYALNSSFEETNRISLNSDYLFDAYRKTSFGSKTGESMTYFQDKLVVAMDSSVYVRLSPKLNPIDTFSLDTTNFYNAKTKFYANSSIFTSGDVLNIEIHTIASRKYYGYLNIIIRMEEFGVIKDTLEIDQSEGLRVYGDSLYRLYQYDKRLEAYFGQGWWSQVQSSFNDFAFRNDKIIVVGNNALLRVANLTTKYTEEISSGYRPLVYMAPIIAQDNSLLLFNASSRGTSLFMNRKQADRFEIKPSINMGENYFADFLFMPMRHKYYDPELNRFYAIAYENDYMYAYLYTSDDYGATYTESTLKSINFPYYQTKYYENANLEPELSKLAEYFILPMKLEDYLKYSSSIYVLNKDFKTDRKIIIPNTALDYCYSLSPLTHFIHCANTLDSASEIRYTTDGGEIWTTIVKYDTNYAEIFVKEVKNKGKNYILVAHRNEIDSSEIIDLIDIDSRYKLKFVEWSKEDDPGFKFSDIRFTYDDDFVYITRGDKLYAYPDLLDKSGMRFRTFPYNGSVTGVFMKYGSRFIATYNDDYYPRPNLCVLDPVIPLSANENMRDRNSDGFYCGEPYPNPASKFAQIELYGSDVADITEESVSLYNLFGEIPCQGAFTIEKTSSTGALLTWNCSGFAPGVYFIAIRRGDTNNLIKAMVNR